MENKKEYKNDDKKCECYKCEIEENCIHTGAFRRLPKEIGGLSMCPKLKEKK